MRASIPAAAAVLLAMSFASSGALPHPLSGAETPSTAPELPDVSDLPLVVVPTNGSSGEWMAVHITGDGGWGVTDKGLSTDLADNEIPVVGLNSLRYFWTARTPEVGAKDLERILIHFAKKWSKDRVVIIGYSMGADVLPFLINRLSPDAQSRLGLIVLIGLGHHAQFHFHLMNWLRRPSGGLPVVPELEKIEGVKVLCFYGLEDRGALCPELKHGFVEATGIEGGHRVGRRFGVISQKILERIANDTPRP